MESIFLFENYSLDFYRLFIAVPSYFCHIFSLLVQPEFKALIFSCHQWIWFYNFAAISLYIGSSVNGIERWRDGAMEGESVNGSKKIRNHLFVMLLLFHIVHSGQKVCNRFVFLLPFPNHLALPLQNCMCTHTHSYIIDYPCEWVIFRCRWNIRCFHYVAFHRRKFPTFMAKM